MKPHVFAARTLRTVSPLHWLRSRSLTRSHVVVAVCAASSALVICHNIQDGRRKRSQLHNAVPTGSPFLSLTAVDALSGALGESIQVAILYPLDTIRVHCQAQGAGTRTVLGQFAAQGLNVSTLLKLYAGVVPSALLAALVGAVYMASFHGCKRLARSRSARGHTGLDVSNQSPTKRAQTKPAAHGTAEENSSLDSQAGTALAAALVSSVAASMIDAPVELFKHRTQAGMAAGDMVRSMGAAVSAGGVAALYSRYLPFLIRTIPYDIAELFTYHQLSEMRARPVEAGKARNFLQRVPPELGDLLIGALSGASAVLCSMPCDCVKTRMELMTVAMPKGLAANTRFFLQTGSRMVMQGGLQSLFAGMVPRLACVVPSSMIYWLAVGACLRKLAPHATTA